MYFSSTKSCHEDECTLPSFHSIFPKVSSNVPNLNTTFDTSMTCNELHSLSNFKRQYEAKIEDNKVASLNEIVTAFDSLDSEAAMSNTSILPEIQCRYRNGKCFEPRTLKKNGLMHSFCDYHRQRSVQNQRVFDQKKRQQQGKT
ncbi:hypothetical protein Plhal710r2_c038g0134671 [Plasmopara halstedii]